MLGRLLLLFILVPIVELYLLFVIADATSALFTIVLIILTGVVGASLARQQGTQAWRSVHRQLARGELPSDALVDGLMIFIAGALLITPGVLTDICGFTLLAPAGRRLIKKYLAKHFKATVVTTRQWQEGPRPAGPGKGAPDAAPDDDVIDVEFRKPEEEP